MANEYPTGTKRTSQGVANELCWEKIDLINERKVLGNSCEGIGDIMVLMG